ncbi:hypothetical protein GIB67_008539 [Kingdonia uniflora]|uniref:Jacalin-type lectin domain-containing protein n=1 Tax=Kingdonia uniflora TaxID=39325 RepID=A0A7J7LFL0_9MAGN|nr:hypothetical protein GIB67_008539 [Kingdonia uniflora]
MNIGADASILKYSKLLARKLKIFGPRNATLAELKDQIYCLTDQLMQSRKRRFSGYFFIEDTFCKRSKAKAALGNATKAHLPHFKSYRMHEIRFRDLPFRLGAGYLYVTRSQVASPMVYPCPWGGRLSNPWDFQPMLEIKQIMIRHTPNAIISIQFITVKDNKGQYIFNPIKEIKQIMIRHTPNAIISIQFITVKDNKGNSIYSDQFGGSYDGRNDYAMDKVKIRSPDEYLTSLSWSKGYAWDWEEKDGGDPPPIVLISLELLPMWVLMVHMDQVKIHSPDEYLSSLSWSKGYAWDWEEKDGGDPPPIVLTSLEFVTNVGTYGPYGLGNDSRQTFPIESGVIVGFFGGRGWSLDSIGVYLKPSSSRSSENVNTQQAIEIYSSIGTSMSNVPDKKFSDKNFIDKAMAIIESEVHKLRNFLTEKANEILSTTEVCTSNIPSKALQLVKARDATFVSLFKQICMDYIHKAKTTIYDQLIEFDTYDNTVGLDPIPSSTNSSYSDTPTKFTGKNFDFSPKSGG